MVRFVLLQNEVCYTKYQRFGWKTAEGRTKGAWEPHAALGTAVENHWSTGIRTIATRSTATWDKTFYHITCELSNSVYRVTAHTGVPAAGWLGNTVLLLQHGAAKVSGKIATAPCNLQIKAKVNQGTEIKMQVSERIWWMRVMNTMQ